MPRGTNAAILAGGSPAAGAGRIVPPGRRGPRGKNGSAPPSGTPTRRYLKGRDGEIRANSGLPRLVAPTQFLVEFFVSALADPTGLGPLHPRRQ
jgi:hypothetical protein